LNFLNDFLNILHSQKGRSITSYKRIWPFFKGLEVKKRLSGLSKMKILLLLEDFKNTLGKNLCNILFETFLACPSF